VGIFYLYRSYIANKRKQFAILKSIGLHRQQILVSQVLNLTLLAALGTLISFFFGGVILPLLGDFISRSIPFSLDLTPSFEALMGAFLIGFLGVFSISFPLLLSLIEEKPSNLFLEASAAEKPLRTGNILRFIPFFLFFTGLSIWLSKSVVNGLIFIGVFVALIALFFPLLYWALGKVESRIKLPSLGLTLGLRYLARYRLSTISIFLAITFGSLLMTFIPSLQESIQVELDGGLKGDTPSLFLFDIQEDQVEDLRTFTKERNLDLLGLSPMIRARLIKKNGEEFKVEEKDALTREGQREQRFRNRGLNLTYALETNESETLLEGRPLKAYTGEGLPDISLEFRYASRMGIELHDRVTFDIGGIEIEAKVVNIRRVRWTSFRPNFFIVFAPNVLEDAPKTFLAAIPKLDREPKVLFQTGMVNNFPNVSAVDLERLVEKIKSILQQMSFALTFMSGLVVFVGMIVIFALINHQMRERRPDMTLLKILGFDLPRLRRSIVTEFSLLALSSSFLGSSLGVALSLIFSVVAFEGLWVLNFEIPLIVLLSLTLLVFCLSSVLVFLMTRKREVEL
jgi:putative ABC transport system permease protein